MPENITCYNQGKFVYKVNEKYAYRYIDIPQASSPQTELTDFTHEEILAIFSAWNELYNKYSDAINAFYETSLNWYSPPASQIRNYISFIDSITKEFKGENGNVNPKSKRAKRVQEILEKADSVLDKKIRRTYRIGFFILQERNLILVLQIVRQPQGATTR